jgi:hypothetical protein
MSTCFCFIPVSYSVVAVLWVVGLIAEQPAKNASNRKSIFCRDNGIRGRKFSYSSAMCAMTLRARVARSLAKLDQ